MKNTNRLWITLAVPFFVAAFFSAPSYADPQAERDAYERKITQQVQDLELKVDEARDNYKKEGIDVNEQIQRYQDRISEIKREANEKLRRDDWNKDQNGFEANIERIQRDFYEWRLKRSIASHQNKLDDLKENVRNETNQERKRDFEARIKKLEAENDAVRSKYNILKVTPGEDWNKVQKELDVSLDEIDQDFEEYKEINKS